jgi:acyl carrier protein
MADEELLDGVDAQVEQENTRASDPEPSYVTETEREVAHVFAEMLQAKRVFREDDVFTLGGDSFEAVRIALELEYRFNVEFPVEMLESTGRVCDLAAWIDEQRRSAAPLATQA